MLLEWVRKLVSRFSRPSTRFKKNDSVQLLGGGPLMVVKEVEITGTQIRVLCTWYDKSSQSSRSEFFSEEQLKLFDWYHPDER